VVIAETAVQTPENAADLVSRRYVGSEAGGNPNLDERLGKC